MTFGVLPVLGIPNVFGVGLVGTLRVRGSYPSVTARSSATGSTQYGEFSRREVTTSVAFFSPCHFQSGLVCRLRSEGGVTVTGRQLLSVV